MPVVRSSVRTLAKSGDTGLKGAVTLSEGSNITLTQSGQDIEIASTGGGGATTALDNLASVAINTDLLPGDSDGAALGSATKMFSDLFLASGAVINFDNSEITITNANTNELDIAGSAGAEVNFNTVKVDISGSGASTPILGMTMTGGFSGPSVNVGGVELQGTDAGAGGPRFNFYHNSASAAANDWLGFFDFHGKDDGGTRTEYAGFGAISRVITDTAEVGDMIFYAGNAGSAVRRLTIPGDVIGIEVGSRAATGVLTSGGDFDLQLKTGNSTTGTITITDGADANITLAPNGTGKVVAAGVQIKDAADGFTLTGGSSDARTLTVTGGDVTLDASGTLADGELLIGHAGNNEFQVATLTEGNGIDITNAAGGITIATNSTVNIRYVQATVVDYTTDVATGDGKYYMHVPTAFNGMNLVYVHAEVITAGTTNTTDIQIHNLTQTADMLSTKLTIDSTETGSDTAATPAVIDTGNDDVATNDVIRIDVDAVSTTAPKGLIVTLGFQLP